MDSRELCLQNSASFTGRPATLGASPEKKERYKAVLLLSLLVLVFLIIESFVPMRTAVQIGADEGLELAKATLCVQGHHLYTDVWNDQPPLHTFLVTEILRHLSPSVLGPRLLTVGFSVVLLAAVFVIVRRVNGGLVAALVTGLIIGSPGFIELSSSCMLEIPALATALAAIALLCVGTGGRGRPHPDLLPKAREGDIGPSSFRVFFWEVASGAVFGLALQMKLVPVIYLPLVALFVFIAHRDTENRSKKMSRLAVFGISLVALYVGSDLLIERGAYLTHFQQSWTSHFGAPKTTEYGSAKEHPFDWSVLLKNWDATVPAMVGAFLLLRRRLIEWDRKRHAPSTTGGGYEKGTVEAGETPALPGAWIVLTFAVFGIHKPWWAYYYLHTAIPLCWYAGIAIEFLLSRLKECMRRNATQHPKHSGRGSLMARIPAFRWAAVFAAVVFGISGMAWMGARVYLQVVNLRRAPQIDNSPVIVQMKRFKPFTNWLYADKVIYSFHSGIPIVPSLAVMPVKRLWSGELNNEGLRREVSRCKPGLIVLLNDGRDVPFEDLLDAEYQIVYIDSDNRFYALKSVARKTLTSE